MSFSYEWYFAVKLATSTMKRISKPHCLHRRFCQIMPIGNFLTFTYELWQRRSGKLMFSQMSVCHSVQGVPYVTITHDALDLTVSPPWSPAFPTSDLGPPIPHLLLISGGQHWRPFQTCSPQVATSGGGHWSMYDLQVGSAHFTGMLSCWYWNYTELLGEIRCVDLKLMGHLGLPRHFATLEKCSHPKFWSLPYSPALIADPAIVYFCLEIYTW